MGVSKIEQLIEDIYEFVESCKMQPLSSTKVIVPKDELYDLLDELRLRTPDEIKRYQKIISNRDAIISDAEEKAATILAEAREKTSVLINEHEIMQQAYFQANEVVNQANDEAYRIVEEATRDGEQIRAGALGYTDEMLTELENIMANAYESTRVKAEQLITSIKGNLDIVSNNKREICDQLNNGNGASAAAEEAAPAVAEEDNLYKDEDFDFNEDTFLEDIELDK